jgi:sorbitol-specific phosphotransferase system component IIA
MAKKSLSLGKAEEVLSKSFVDNVKDLTPEELQELVIQCEKTERKLKLEKKNDARLNAAKDLVKDLGSAYNSAISYEESKKSFLMDRIEEIDSEIPQD